ncbi:MAG TPA: amino-acid N-acetyltransferase [Opitutaceae bacterium]|jgi:amino-acid N-acetyltransferase|nr:amino-acid N-acetyltransferase [Opitutaceae bacterium]HOG93353.1 amino-acid N-acetyltransferase [Opitutaceae bacterium]HOY53535.1 amino-acid N-acetyltransferase [Opitutaceae bacterium]HPG16478.1 amino-acid N-acetyltransferase [Opitutaceae bacterium]HPN99312.1 amino-acid N-acetyltransferase [Opitutaceae bacterium]
MSTSPAAPVASTATIKPTDLRGILKYVPRFQDQIFVLALDGAIVADENLPNLLVDIAVLRSLAIKVVIVHGIGQQIQELSKLRQVPITNSDGTGVTDAATLDLAVRASARVSHVILEGLTQNALKAAITNSVRALPVGILRGIDQQFTGKVERIDKDLLIHLLNAGVVPILQPIGFGPDGRSLRVNSDLLASEVAEALHASKIIYLNDQPGLLIDGKLKREIPVNALRAILKDKPERIADPIRSKATHAVKAIENGILRVHLLDGQIMDGLLNEIFSSEGVGSLVYGNDYQQIRQATRRDVRVIYNLTRAAVKREELIHRTQQAIEKNIDQFFVFEIDENIIACVTLYFYPDKPQLAEVGSLYVMPFYQNRGIGKKMVDYACLQAKERGATTIVALSTQSFGFFSGTCGFEETDKSILPEARLKLYEESGRNPRVLVKQA